MYEGTPTEAQFVEIVEKLDQSDVRKLLHQAVDYLDQSDVRKLLVNAAVSNELVETKVVGELTRIRRLCENGQVRRYQDLFTPPLQPARPVPQPERPVVLEIETETETEALGFEKNIQQVDDIINKRYAKLRGPKQLEKAGEAADLVKQEIAKIAQSTTRRSQYETKMNAILALLDIGNIIIDGTNSISAEVRKQVGYNESFARTVMDIVALMLPDEVQAFAEDDIQTLEEFSIKRRACDIFDGFEEVVNHFGCTLLASSGLGYNPYGDDDYGDIDE